MTSVDSNFNFLCERPHGAGPPPPVHMRPPEHDPLRVDVINRWPYISIAPLQVHYYSEALPTTALIRSRSYHAKVPSWQLEWDLNLRPSGRKASNLPLSHHAPYLVAMLLEMHIDGFFKPGVPNLWPAGQKWNAKPQKVALDLSKNKKKNIF